MKINVKNKKQQKHFNPYFTPCIKSNTRWITDLNIKAEITKFSEENKIILEAGKGFLERTTESNNIKKNGKLDFIKAKNSSKNNS